MSSNIHSENPSVTPPGNIPHDGADRSRASLAKRTAFLAGGFGVLSGFAIFFLMLEKADQPILFLGVLGVASVLSAVFEWLREQIDHPHAQHHGQRSVARLLVFFVVLAVAEFHVMSWEAFTVVSASDKRSTVIFSIIGSSVSGSDRVYLDLAFLFISWVLAGAVLSFTLLRQLEDSEGSLRQRMFRGARVGAFTGALVAPLCLLGYVLVVWLVRGLGLLLFEPVTWQQNLHALGDLAKAEHSGIFGVFWLLFSGMLRVAAFFGDHRLGAIAVIVIAIILVAVLARFGKFGSASFLAVAVVAAVIAPLLEHLDALLGVLLGAALVWVVPGIVLGAMAPLLRETSEERKPRSWALVAFACAVVLFFITVLRFQQSWWLIVPAGLFAAMGFTLRRVSRADEYWLPMAVGIGVLVWGAMLGVQSVASFAGVYDAIHKISTLSPEMAPSYVLPKSNAPAEHLKASGKRPQVELSDILKAAEMERMNKAKVASTTLAAVEIKLKLAEDLATILYANAATCMTTAAPFLDSESIAHGTDAKHEHQPEVHLFEHLTELIKTHRESLALIQDCELLVSIHKEDDPTHPSFQRLRQQVTEAFPQKGTIGDRMSGSDKFPGFAASQGSAAPEAKILARIDASLATLDGVKKQLKAIEPKIADAVRVKRQPVVRWLELALAGSVGFWTAISLLVGWAMQRKMTA